MKFKKVKNVFLFSRYIREDGKIQIESMDKKINGTFKPVFEVKNLETGEVIEYAKKLKDAKAKYAE